MLCPMNMDVKKRQIGKAIQRNRKAQKLSQRKLAAMASTTQTEICKIENGELNFGINVLLRISEALDVDVREFFSF